MSTATRRRFERQLARPDAGRPAEAELDQAAWVESYRHFLLQVVRDHRHECRSYRWMMTGLAGTVTGAGGPVTSLDGAVLDARGAVDAVLGPEVVRT